MKITAATKTSPNSLLLYNLLFSFWCPSQMIKHVVEESKQIKRMYYEKTTYSSYQTVFVRITRCSCLLKEMKHLTGKWIWKNMYGDLRRIWKTQVEFLFSQQKILRYKEWDTNDKFDHVQYTYLLNAQIMDTTNSKGPQKISNDLQTSPHAGFWTLIHPLQPKKRASFSARSWIWTRILDPVKNCGQKLVCI